MDKLEKAKKERTKVPTEIVKFRDFTLSLFLAEFSPTAEVLFHDISLSQID